MNLKFQIDEILDMESQKDLEDGKNPGPMTEIQFWDIRHDNMKGLHDQLNSELTRSMVSILKQAKSGYYTMFRF